MFSGRGLVAIDRPRARTGPVEEDVASFLTFLAAADFGANDLQRASATFLAGYGLRDDQRERLRLSVDRLVLAQWVRTKPHRARFPRRRERFSAMVRRIEYGQPAIPALRI